MSMMGDTQTLALAQMQWLGECPDPWPINSELGTLADELPSGHHWFRFMRYDLGLEKPWFQKYLDKDLAEDVVARLPQHGRSQDHRHHLRATRSKPPSGR